VANGASVWAVVPLEAPGKPQVALAETSGTGIGATELAMIDGAQRLAAVALPHVGHKVFQIGDAVALTVALVVHATTAIDAIGWHSVATESAVAAVALVDQRITARGALDHGVQPSNVPLSAISLRQKLFFPAAVVGEAPLHGVTEGIVYPRYVHILNIHQVLHLSWFTSCLCYHAYVRHPAIEVVVLELQTNLVVGIRVLPADRRSSVPVNRLGA